MLQRIWGQLYPSAFLHEAAVVKFLHAPLWLQVQYLKRHAQQRPLIESFAWFIMIFNLRGSFCHQLFLELQFLNP